MKAQTLAGLVAWFCLTLNAAGATVFSFSATGVASGLSTYDNAFRLVSNPPATIKPGDAISVSFRFEASGLTPTGLYDTDPTINIYYSNVTNFTMLVGSFSYGAGPANSFTTFELWNNHIIGNGVPTDLLGISTIGGTLPSGTGPVSQGAGPVTVHFGFQGQDLTGAARSSDLISDQPPLSGYGIQGANVGFLNTATNYQTLVSVLNLRATLVPSTVPEPTSWAMMIVGVGMIGATMRRRQFGPSRAQAYGVCV